MIRKSQFTVGLKVSGDGLVAKLCPTLATPWTVACQAPLCMGFSRQEYWNGLPFPSPGQRMFNFNICYSFMAIKCSISFTGF